MALGPSVPESDILPLPHTPEEVLLYNALKEYMLRNNDFLQFMIQLPVNTVTTTYTVTAGDYTVLGDTTGGGFTITLPPASPNKGRIFIIKKTVAANTLTIDGDGSETIDGLATQALTTQYDSITVHSDGSNWHILNNKA